MKTMLLNSMAYLWRYPTPLSYYVHLVGTFAVCWISCKWKIEMREGSEGEPQGSSHYRRQSGGWRRCSTPPILIKNYAAWVWCPCPHIHTYIHTYNYMKFSWKFRTLTASPANRHCAPLRGIIEAKCIWGRRRHASLPDLINGNVLNGFLWQLVVVISGNHKRVRVPVHDASHHTQ